MKIGFAGFSIRGLQELLENVLLFKFQEGGRAQTRAIADISFDGLSFEDSACFLIAELTNGLSYDRCDDSAVRSANKLVFLRMISLEGGIRLDVMPITNYGRWDPPNFDELRKLDLFIRNLNPKVLPFPDSFKGTLFDPIKGERI